MVKPRQLYRRGRGLNNNRPGARARVAPGVGGDVVDGVGCHLRGVDDDVARKRAVQECFVAEIVALVVVHDCAEVGVGVADMDYRGIVSLDVDRWGSGRSGNDRRRGGAYLH